MKKDKLNKVITGAILIIALVIVVTYFLSTVTASSNRTELNYEFLGVKYTENDYFKEIPSKPINFKRISDLYHNYGHLYKLRDISEQYWMQPEWVTRGDSWGLCSQSINNEWARMDDSHPDAGYGMYPTKLPEIEGMAVVNETLKHGQPYKDELVQGDFLIYSSCMVYIPQAIGFKEEFPEHGRYSGNIIYSNPNIAKTFEVQISPRDVLLEPSYPISKYGWVQRVSVDIIVPKGTPIGFYVVKIVPTSASSGFMQDLADKLLKGEITMDVPNTGAKYGVGDATFIIQVK